MLTKNYVTESFLRGGGCGNSKSNPVQVQNSNNIQPNVHEFFSRFNYYISIIDSKSHMTANEQESQEIMIAIQWFIYQEENIYNLNKNTQYVKKSYDLILDGIIRLIKSCLIYIRTDSFKCLYILQITSSLSKVIFSFHLINEERFMNSETQRQFLQISSELEQLMEIEKNDLIQNQMELYLNLTNTSFEIAPTNQEDKEEILKGCLKGIIKYILTLGEDVDLIELLFQGACLLQKMSTVNQKKKQYEVYYQLDMLQWEVINYFKNYKQKDLEEILSQMEMIYDKLVKNSKNWKDHYCWIQMIGKILIYNPLLTKTKLIQTNKYLNLELNSSSSQWKEYQKKGIIFQVNHSHDQAIILLNQLQNKKLLQNELLIIEDSFKGWENFIQFKEFLMNDQNENNQYTFGSYLKCKLELNSKNINKDDIYAINKIEKFLGFILPNKQLILIKQNVEKLGIVLKCWQNLTKNKKANTRISQVTCQQQIQKLINNLLEYYQNTLNIIKIIKLNQNKNFFNVEFLQQQKKMEQFNNLQKLKYLMKLLELILQQEIQEFKEKMDDEKSQTLKHSDKIDDIEILQQEKQYIIREIKKLNDLQDEKLQLANNLYSKLSFLPSTSHNQKDFMKKALSMIQFIQISEKEIYELEKFAIQNSNLIQCFIDSSNNLIMYYQTIGEDINLEFDKIIKILKEIITIKYEIEAINQTNEQSFNIQYLFSNRSSIQQIYNFKFKMLKLQLMLTVFNDSFKNIITQAQSEQLLQLQDAINLNQFLLDVINDYPKRIIKCNSNLQNQTRSELESLKMIQNEYQNKFSNAKGLIEYLIVILNLEEQQNDSEITDLKLLEKEFGEDFEEASLHQLIENMQKIIILINETMKKTNEVNFNQQYQKFELEKYEHFLKQFKILLETNNNKKLIVVNLEKIINQLQIIVQILNKSLKQNFEIFQILIIEELGKLREIINQQNEILLKYHENKIQQNNQKNYINSINIILKILQIQQILIKEQKNYLVQFLQEIVDFSSQINLIQSYNVEKQKDITKFFNLSYQKQINNFIELQYTIGNLKCHFQENESSLNYLERILIDLQQDITQIKKDGGKPNIYDLLNKQKVKIQNQLEEKSYKQQELFIEQEFYVLQIYNINQLDGLPQEIDGESNQQLLLSDFWIQKLKHNKKNEEWKIKEGLVFAIIQISSNCFTDTIISFCQKALIQIWAKEKDQRIRNLLKNKRIISLQMQLLQKDWKTQHDRIADEMQNMLNKIDDLQEQISHEINHNKRDQQLQKLDQTTQQLDEYIENISDMGQQLKLITDFLNYIRKGLTRFERKINIMKEQLNSMGNDIKFLRGKSVDQLFEIRKWKVLKEAAQKNIKSIYIPLKTQEKGQLNPSSLINLEQFDDKVGEVNEFLLDEKETVLLIHGVAGSGKSTTAKKLEEFIWKLHDNNIKISNQILIPVYISLPSLKNPVFQAVEETLHQDEYGFDDLQLKECKEMLEKKEFRFLFIMDSYDEMKLENIQKNLYITNKLNQNWSNPLVIFTTRSEILTTSNYKEWFVPEDKKQIKEVQLLKFDEMQKKEYLTKFTLLSIKVLVFEIYEWQTQMKYQSSIDIQNFEKSWEKLHTEVLKQFITNVNSESLLNQKQIESIFLFLKNDNHIALKSIEAIRSLGVKLQKLWSVRKYENMIKMINLDKLIQTPYMMEIIVSVLPLMMVKKTEIINLKQNFIKNFSKMYRELLKSEYLIKMYANNNKNQEASRLEMQFIEKYDYIQTAIEIWNKMEENQIPNQFQISQEINELNIKLIKIFQHNYKNILGIKDEIIQKVQINFERLIELICDALKEQNLTSYDFYDEFIKQYHLKQIEKQRNLGKSINTDRFLYDLYKYSIKLAKQMSIKEMTQVQYKQQGLLYKVENEEEKWLNEFFNDDGQDGSYKIDIRSCSLIQQKGANFQFVHKSIQQFLISADLYELLVLSKDLDVKIFSKLIEIFIYEKVIDCLGFLQNDVNQKHYEFCIQLDNLSLYDKQQKLNIIEKNIKNITNIVRMLKQHDLNLINYSTEIYVETRKQLIQQIYQEKNIIEFLKFIVHLTAFDQSFIQSGSNSLNLLVEMKVDLTNLCFRNIKIKNTSLIGASFVKCDLSESQFENVKINGINLNGAQLFNCKWKNLQMNELHKLEGHTSDVNSVCFSPDGTMLASGSADKSIHLWDVKTGKNISKLEGHSHWVNSVCFSPNGTLLASGSWDNTIRLWDVKTNQVKFKLEKQTKYIQSVCFCPDGNTLASGGSDNTIRLWDVKTGQEKSKLVGHNDSVFSISFSPDGTKLASGSADKSIRLWDLKTGKEQQKLEGHNESINSVCFSPDGTTLAYGCRDCTIHLWDIKAQVEKYKLEGHNSYVLSVCFSPDGTKLASGSWDNTIRLWDVNTGQENSKLEGQSDGIYSVCFSPDGTILAAGSADKSIRLWDVKTKQEKLQLEGHSDSVNFISFSPDGISLISGGSDNFIRLWDIKTGQEKLQLKGHSKQVQSVCFSHDGATLASGSFDKTIRIWDLKTGQEKLSLEGHSENVNSVSFSPDGTILASGSSDYIICLWDLRKGQKQSSLEGHSDSVISVSFSSDGIILASGSRDNTIRLWDIRRLQEKFKLEGHNNFVYSVCFSPDGNTLASGSWDNTIRLWDVKKGQRKLQLKGHIKQVQSLCFSPDGTILASGGWDNAIRLWNVKTGEEKFKLDGHINQVLSVCFSPDGFTLASSSADKSIRIWDIKDALSNQISIHSNQDILIQNSDYQDPLGIISNILTIVLISQQGLLEAQGTQIQKGSFTNHLGMDMRIHFKQKGAHLLEHQLESEQNAVQI